MQLDLNLATLLRHGGLTLALLLLASLWSWVIIVERWLAFRRAERGDARLPGRLARLAKAGQGAEARRLAQETQGSLGRVLQAGLAHPSRDRVVLAEAMGRESSEELLALERRLAALGTLGSVAPYVGLFGTVLGIIRSFQALGQGAADAASAAAVSAGIAESLVATAAGLAVAVPAVICFNAYSRRLAALEARLQLASSELAEALSERPRRQGVDDGQD